MELHKMPAVRTLARGGYKLDHGLFDFQCKEGNMKNYVIHSVHEIKRNQLLRSTQLDLEMERKFSHESS